MDCLRGGEICTAGVESGKVIGYLESTKASIYLDFKRRINAGMQKTTLSRRRNNKNKKRKKRELPELESRRILRPAGTWSRDRQWWRGSELQCFIYIYIYIYIY